jgi:hypothetical protein
VVGAGEVGDRVGHQERLEVAHERLDGGGLAADVRVDAGDQQLVPAERRQLPLEGAALERAVAPLDHDGVRRLRGELGSDVRRPRVGVDDRADALAPELPEQPAVTRVLPARLGGVEHRHAERPGEPGQPRDVRRRLRERRPGVGREEVPLHVVLPAALRGPCCDRPLRYGPQ